jgi:tripeptidyl-peptidase I
VTSVGATQVAPRRTVTQPEQAAESVIYSGGGFSNVFPMPSYQAEAVKSWFEHHEPTYGADRYNNSQMTRGYPDISANGVNYVTTVDGRFARVFGTSKSPFTLSSSRNIGFLNWPKLLGASSPTLGSILTMINSARMSAGKSSIGFINPVLYEHPRILNDIEKGDNQGCGTPGFTAVEGWDPVTGLGTPNFPKMLDLWLELDWYSDEWSVDELMEGLAIGIFEYVMGIHITNMEISIYKDISSLLARCSLAHVNYINTKQYVIKQPPF